MTTILYLTIGFIVGVLTSYIIVNAPYWGGEKEMTNPKTAENALDSFQKKHSEKPGELK